MLVGFQLYSRIYIFLLLFISWCTCLKISTSLNIFRFWFLCDFDCLRIYHCQWLPALLACFQFLFQYIQVSIFTLWFTLASISCWSGISLISLIFYQTVEVPSVSVILFWCNWLWGKDGWLPGNLMIPLDLCSLDLHLCGRICVFLWLFISQYMYTCLGIISVLT